VNSRTSAARRLELQQYEEPELCLPLLHQEHSSGGAMMSFTLIVGGVLSLAAAVEASAKAASVTPMPFARGDILANLKEIPETPMRTISRVGARETGKCIAVVGNMFGQGAIGKQTCYEISSIFYLAQVFGLRLREHMLPLRYALLQRQRGDASFRDTAVKFAPSVPKFRGC